MGSLTIIFILELITGFIAFFFVDKVIGRPFFLLENCVTEQFRRNMIQLSAMYLYPDGAKKIRGVYLNIKLKCA